MPSAVCEWVAGTTICLGLAGLIGLLPGDLPTDSLLGKESLSAEKILLKCDETESDPSRSDQSELTRDKGLSPLGIELQKRSEVLPFVQLSEGARGFVLAGTSQSFRPWGFNYDHDERGRLLEDYWESEWAKVEEDFAEMKALGANCVRVHLQFGQFMEAIDKPNSKALRQLERLLRLAEQQGLYLDLTGLGCYHKKDVPAWYDALDEAGRWQAQARFWTAVAERAAHSPAVFCYDLMNEPVVPGGKREAGDWLPPPFGDKHFVQFITLDQGQRTRPEIARAWIRQLVQAIRRV
ncbi:MAG: cellulase family glycosylhydrolase, partial [Gemmataceae bacterium]|nr:cellulase family glycosylhydrolase [Gemmataceae bacterium]